MNTRTNIVIDDKLIKRAMKISGTTTKREVVDLALRRLVSEEKQAKAQRAILELAGTGAIADDYDYKKARSGD